MCGSIVQPQSNVKNTKTLANDIQKKFKIMKKLICDTVWLIRRKKLIQTAPNYSELQIKAYKVNTKCNKSS